MNVIDTIPKEYRRWATVAIVGAVAALTYYFLQKEINALFHTDLD